MPASQIDLATFTSDHLSAIAALSRAAGWPHRPEDWELVRELGTGAVAIADGRVVGTIFLTPFGSDVATVSGVIVDEARRGQGIGRRLLEWALHEAGDRECRLVATEDGLPLYQRLGFQACSTVRQYQAPLGPMPTRNDAVWIGADRIASCSALDRAAYGADRSGLVGALFARGRLAALPDGSGFAALRPFGRGEVVGPVVAGTLDEAQTLLGFLFAAHAGGLMRVDTAVPALGQWLEAQGLVCVDTGIEMHRAERPRAPTGCHRFALASQALG